MSLIQHLKHSYLWNKYYYYLSFALTISAAIFYYVEFEPFDVFSYPLVLFALVFSFASFQKDQFSLKYLQSLPLSKSELYHLKLGENLLAICPLFFWGIIFHPIVLGIFSDVKSYGLKSVLHLLVYYVLTAFLIAIWSFYRLYESNRLPYVKGNPKIYNYIMLRSYILYALVASYLVYSSGLSIYLLEENFPVFLNKISAFLAPLNSSWSFLATVIALTAFEYNRVFRRWMDEKRSYIKYNWNGLRDVPLMSLALVLILLPPFYASRLPTNEFGKSTLVELVKDGELLKIDQLVKSGVDINAKSDLGYTPLMAAAQLGRETIYFFLLSKGARKEGKVHKSLKMFGNKSINFLAVYGGNEAIVKDLVDSKNVNQLHGDSYLLHLAAYRCHERVLDHLLELGADPNVKVTAGKKSMGKTPLHFASEKNCLNGVISLIEGGADVKLRDKSGLLASDFVKKKNRDLAYYFERKSRSPAGK